MLRTKLSELATENLLIRGIHPTAFVFDDKTHIKCFYCEKYGRNHCCPPNLPALDYQALIHGCGNARLFCYQQNFTKEITVYDRCMSSSALHKAIVKAERILWENNKPLALAFIGGSCKACGCGCPEECRSPKRRIPLEAVGVDITKTALAVGIKITYPPKDFFWRVGAVLW